MNWSRSLAFATLLLAGCDQSAPSLAVFDANRGNAATNAGQIVCASTASPDFARACTIDRTQAAEGLILTLRHPDGHFRRLLVTQDGRGVIAADGAETPRVSLQGVDEIEVELGGDRYRLPATVRSPAKPGP